MLFQKYGKEYCNRTYNSTEIVVDIKKNHQNV